MRIVLLLGIVAAVTPVQKVVQLLNGMLEKGKSQRHEEQVQFATYKQFCEDTSADKKAAIKEANREITSLQAAIESADVDVERLGTDVHVHQLDISTWNGDASAALKVRKLENTDYSTTHRDYSESIDALERAIAVLKKQAFDRKQAPALAQLKVLPLIPDHAKKVLDAFLQDMEDPLSVSAPDANAYEFQSTSVVDMLQKLLDKFADEVHTLEKEEMNAKHAHSMLQQDLKAQITTASEASSAKQNQRAIRQQAGAKARGQLNDTTSSRDADQKYLTDLTATCQSKSNDFTSRQELRAEEITTIEKAVEILSSNNVAGAADKYLPKLMQVKSFLQVSMGVSDPEPRQTKVASFLDQQAKRIHSHVLSTLALRATEDPFIKVKQMIQQLLVRLQEQANAEAEHKGWCDKELAVNEQTRTQKTTSVENLHAEIDSLDASIAKITEEVASLSNQVVELDTAVSKAIAIRAAEKKENEQTIADSESAQTALAQALTVLKEFYQKAGTSTALIQQQPVSPEIFDSPYTGMASEKGGVVGMLEVIESDFARLETETRTSEVSSQREHDTFLQDSAVDKAKKSKDIEHKGNLKVSHSSELTNRKSDLGSTQKELDAALRYFDKLKPSCVNAGVSYEERVGRRKEEIESLQEALRILNGEELA